MSDFIDDISNEKHLEVICARAREGRPIPLSGCGRSRTAPRTGSTSAETHGRKRVRDATPICCTMQHWLDTLIDLCERGGVGSLEHREDGAIVFVPAARVPDAAEAWRRATRLTPAG